MQTVVRNITSRIFAIGLAAALALVATGCVKQTSDDASVLEDAGTQEGAAIVVDPNDE